MKAITTSSTCFLSRGYNNAIGYGRMTRSSSASSCSSRQQQQQQHRGGGGGAQSSKLRRFIQQLTSPSSSSSSKRQTVNNNVNQTSLAVHPQRRGRGLVTSASAVETMVNRRRRSRKRNTKSLRRTSPCSSRVQTHRRFRYPLTERKYCIRTNRKTTRRCLNWRERSSS